MDDFWHKADTHSAAGNGNSSHIADIGFPKAIRRPPGLTLNLG